MNNKKDIIIVIGIIAIILGILFLVAFLNDRYEKSIIEGPEVTAISTEESVKNPADFDKGVPETADLEWKTITVDISSCNLRSYPERAENGNIYGKLKDCRVHSDRIYRYMDTEENVFYYGLPITGFVPEMIDLEKGDPFEDGDGIVWVASTYAKIKAN